MPRELASPLFHWDRGLYSLKIGLLLVFLYSIVQKGEGTAVDFLARYGYLHFHHDPEEVPHEELVKAITEYQAFVGLNATGKLDNATVHKMSLPRCGVKDKETSLERERRYIIQGSRWSKKHLTYNISKYSAHLDQKQVDEIIWKAFHIWSHVTPLTFAPMPTGPVDIDIRFEVGEHGDGKNMSFDGPGGALAHASFPIFGGGVHFDDAEKWSLTDEGINLYSVAIHEFGHSLGLHHTEVFEAVMAPYYKHNYFGLHEDDVDGVQSLYGERNFYYGPQTPSYRPQIPFKEDKFPDLCEDPTIDAIFTTVFGNTYIFKGKYYWQLIDGKLVHFYPRRIKDTWFGLPKDIDAAFTYIDGRTFFFKDFQFWSYKGRFLEEGYPKDISKNLKGVPSNIDAALVWGGKLYFFKGSHYWGYAGENASRPKSIAENWPGVPDDLDAAYPDSEGSIYFIKGNLFYKFKNGKCLVGNHGPPYPRNLTEFVYGCHDK